MVSEPMATKIQTKPKLSIQTFHQCASLISIKLNNNNTFFEVASPATATHKKP